MNARDLPQEALPQGLQQFRPGPATGFGWEGQCVDVATSTDNTEALRFCHDHGFINHETRTLYGKTLRAYCEEMIPMDGMRVSGFVRKMERRQRAPLCAEALAKLGYPL